MRRAALLAAVLLALTVTARASADVPFADALPRAVAEAGPDEILPQTLRALGTAARAAAEEALRSEGRGAAKLILAALLCALAAPFEREGGSLVPLLGVLAVGTIAAGDLSTLLGLAVRTVEELGELTRLLVPTLAAAMAAGGLAATAGVWQAATVFAADALASLMRAALLPLICCHVGASAAEAALGDGRLSALCTAAEKLTARALTALTLAFAAYLKLTGVLSGSADRAAVSAAKAAAGAFIPVIGGALSEAAESVLAGAGALRGTIGALGVAAILTLCAAPIVRLAVQLLLYRAAALAAGLVGVGTLQRFLDRLAASFSLLLAMTAAHAALLLTALLTAATMSVGG